MISNTQIDKKLDDYLNGLTDYNELEILFKKEGVHNTQELIAEHKLASLAVQHYNLFQQVQQVHLQFANKIAETQVAPEAKIIRMSPAKTFMRMAAVLVVLLGCVTAYQYITSTGNSFYKNFNENYTISIVRGTEKPGEIVEAYQKGNYKRTAELFSQINNPGNRELFLAANSFIQLNNTTKAIELYQRILTNNQTTSQKFYQDEAEYYLAMAYLKNNETQKALPILTKINGDTNHTYHDKIDKWTLWKMKWLGH